MVFIQHRQVPPSHVLRQIIIIIFPSYLKCVYDITIDLLWLCSYLTGYMTLSPWYIVRYIHGTDMIRYTQ